MTNPQTPINSAEVEALIDQIHAAVIADFNERERRKRQLLANQAIEQFSRGSSELTGMPRDSRFRDFVDIATPVVKKAITAGFCAMLISGSLTIAKWYSEGSSSDQPTITTDEQSPSLPLNCPINPLTTPDQQYVQAKECLSRAEVSGGIVNSGS